jgi:hypothetical protein
MRRCEILTRPRRRREPAPGGTKDATAAIRWWSLFAAIARAQQGDRLRRNGVLLPFGESDPEAKGWLYGFVRGLGELRWTAPQNWACSRIATTEIGPRSRL